MLSIARALSILAVLLTVLTIDSWRVHFLPWGFEGTGYVAFMSFVLAIPVALAGLVIAVARAKAGARAGFAQVVLLSAISLVALATLVAMCPGGC